MPLLTGTDGTRKMSKSFDNYIGVTDPPAEMYGKTMSIPDESILQWFELLLGGEAPAELPPRDAKRELARRDGTPPVLLVLPGSRRGEIRHHLAVFGAALDRLREQGAAFEPVLPTMPHLEAAVREGIASWQVQPTIAMGEAEKRAAFRIAHAALAKSGTVTLELALSGVPMVTAYRLGAAEAFILRRAIKVHTVILANLVIGREVIPEFLQENCTPDLLALALKKLLTDSDLRRKQLEAFSGLDAIMSTGNVSPSVRAADIVLDTMRKGRRGN